MQQLELNQNYSSYVEKAINNFFTHYRNRFGNTKPTFVCIGSPRVSGDAIGPYVGTALLNLDPELKVYGTIMSPVIATNINGFANKLWVKSFCNTPIVAIDACVGESAPGTIWCLESKGIKPGSGCGKDLEFIGNTSIIVTTTNNPNELSIVDNLKIIRISSIIAKSIYDNLCNL